MDYNREHGIIPKSVQKGIRDIIEITKVAEEEEKYTTEKNIIDNIHYENINELIEKLTAEMKKAAANYEFERAAELRDKIIELRGK